MTKDISDAILDIVHACDFVHLCTMAGNYPETRQMTNAMNRHAKNLTLYFMTSRATPKAAQLLKNPNCCLYYFDDKTRHVVRLFGQMEFVSDTTLRRAMWHDDYKAFGYGGPEDENFVLLRFKPEKYKFYIGFDMKTGTISE